MERRVIEVDLFIKLLFMCDQNDYF
jgi:hypothetical protein